MFLALTIPAPASVPAGAAIVKPKLWVYGDSINWESYPKGIKPALSATFGVRSGAFPGTAPCDNLIFLNNDLVNIAHNKPSNFPKYVVFDTVGNSESQCMIDPNTGQYYVPATDAYYAKYTADIDAFAARVAQIGAKLLFVAPPPMRGDTSSIQSNIEAIEAATGNPVTYAAQQAVAPSDIYAQTLPCLPSEGVTKGCSNGTILVRSPDGVHLCPVEMTFPDPCPVYSSGEKRWGSAVGRAVAAQGWPTP